MQHLAKPPKATQSPASWSYVQARVRFLAYHRIKPHAPPLVRAPVNSFEFQPWITYRFRLATEGRPPTTSDHRLRRGLPGYLILFDPHAFVHERQLRTRDLTSRSVFCDISKHFTATHHIPATPIAL